MSWLYANGDKGVWPRTFYGRDVNFPEPFPPLKGPAEADLCVIGAGITGLSAALHAAQAGLSVIVLEAQRVGWGASGRNGGQIGSGFNWPYERLVRRLGKCRAEALWGLSEDAKALTQRYISRYAPNANYRPGLLNVTTRADELATYRAEADTSEIYEFLDNDAVYQRIGSSAYLGGILDRSAGHCNPLAYVLGLAKAACDHGVKIHEGSEVLRIGKHVQTQLGQIRARAVLVATNGYTTALIPQMAARILPLNNYIAVTKPLDFEPFSNLAAMPAVADSQFVVNYFRLSEDQRLVFGGGESYGQKFPKNIGEKVRVNLSRVYPSLKEVRFDYAWGGTLAVTATRLPYLSEVRPGLFVAGGYSGHGLALSGLCGKLVVDAIKGDRSQFDLLANLPVPALPGGRFFGGTITNAAMMYGAFLDHLRRR